MTHVGDVDDSPFAALGGGSIKEDAPREPDPASAGGRDGTAPLLDSPFASGMVGPQLQQQLSQSLAAASTGGQHQQQLGGGGLSSSSAARDSGAQDSDAAPQRPAGARLQGVASILESPFSSCLSAELKGLEVDRPLDKLPDAA